MSMTPGSDRTALSKSVWVGVKVALAFSTFVVVLYGLSGLLLLLGAIPLDESSGRGVVLAGAFTVVSYLVSGALAGVAYWAIQPLKSWVIGWPVMGIVLTGIVYGTFGLTAALAYTYAGFNFLEHDSVEAAWASLPGTTLALALLGGVPGGLYFWYLNRQDRKHRARHNSA
jgi:hypothetical protein